MNSALVTLSLVGWIPLSVVVFALMPPRRAMLSLLIFGWLFLPVAVIAMVGVPNLTKQASISLGLLAGMLIVDVSRLVSTRPTFYDVPIAVWCLSPLVSSLLNGDPLRDGLTFVYSELMLWGIPYLAGRVYCADAGGLAALCRWMVIGAAVYAPLCMWEARMSPQLHRQLYGFAQHMFAQSRRGEGFRPLVFMHHGLMTSLWIGAGALVACWLWRSRATRAMLGLPISVVGLGLAATMLLTRSLGTALLVGLGFGLVLLARWRQAPAIMGLLIVIPLGFTTLRTTGVWTGDSIVDMFASLGFEERSRSFKFRLDNEEVLIDRALERPFFGWGGYGRNRPPWLLDEDVVTDGLWIIAMGQRGIVGLTALLAVLLLPMALLVRRLPARALADPGSAPAVALGVVVSLYAIDCLPNAMVNPVYAAAAAGLIGFLGDARSQPVPRRSAVGAGRGARRPARRRPGRGGQARASAGRTGSSAGSPDQTGADARSPGGSGR